jgi:hypothetical protein
MGLLLCGLSMNGTPARAADATAVPPFATVHEDVPPGEIQQFTSNLDAADDEGGLGVGVTVRIVKLQASVVWAPLFSLCASSTAPARMECLRISVGSHGQGVLVEATSKTETGGVRDMPLDLPVALHPCDAFRVTMRVAKNRSLTFALNGSDISSATLDFDAKQYTYGCSSMVCDLSLGDLRPSQSLTSVGRVALADANLLASGRAALDGGDFDVAIQRFSEFIKSAPLLSGPYALRAQAWIGKGQLARALSDLDEALRLDSEGRVKGSGDSETDQLFIVGPARRDVESLRDEIRARLLKVPCHERNGSECA